jgi:nucleoid-associated protein
VTVKHAIVHLLEKRQLERDVTLQLRAAELVVSERVTNLLTQIRTLYNSRSGRGYGRFKPEIFLTTALRELIEQRTGFVDFTRLCMGDLSSRVAEANLATGGYVVFVMYEDHGAEYLMIVMLKPTPGVTFDHELEILDIEHLDLNRLHFAARVNLTEWYADGERYISFVKGRAADISSYFRKFIGVDELVEGREDTRRLVATLTDYCANAGLPDDEAESLKQRVHSYCSHKVKAGEPVYLEELSTFIDEARPERFLEFANERELAGEIEIDGKSLRPLVRYYGQDRDVSVSFKASAYQTRVTYNQEADALTIRPVPDSLRSQLRN